MRTYIISAVLCLLVASVAPGQEPTDTSRAASDTGLLDPRLKVGARVRVRTSSMQPGDVEGKIIEIRRDTLVINRGGAEPLTVPAGELTHLAVRTLGPARDELTATLATVGLIGGTVGYFSYCSHHRETCDRDIEEWKQDTTSSVPSIFALYAFGSALVGGLLGQALGVAPWEQVDRPLRISVLPARRGFMLVATVPLGRRRR